MLRRTARPKSELTEVAARACLVAKDAAMNLVDLLQSSSQMAYLAVKDCEKELDQMEREVDDKLPPAISRVGESKARELLACLRFVTELERIGDLLLGTANHVRLGAVRLSGEDAGQLQNMGRLLENMLNQIHQGFLKRDRSLANSVLNEDREMDRIRHEVFRRHLRLRGSENGDSLEVLFMAQAMERAGDHATNLAEELLHLIEGRSFRHLPRRKSEN